MMADGRKKNNQSGAQRRASIHKRRKAKPAKIRRDRLEAAKTVLRRQFSDVYDAELDGRRFKDLIRVETRLYSHADVIKMAAEILAREETRNRELRSLYGIKERKQ